MYTGKASCKLLIHLIQFYQWDIFSFLANPTSKAINIWMEGFLRAQYQVPLGET